MLVADSSHGSCRSCAEIASLVIVSGSGACAENDDSLGNAGANHVSSEDPCSAVNVGCGPCVLNAPDSGAPGDCFGNCP